MVTRKKIVRKRKEPVEEVKEEIPEIKVEMKKPVDEISSEFSFSNEDSLKIFQETYFEEIKVLVKKFGSRYGVKLQYLHKFRAFKLLRDGKHVDWITLNDLTKRYDCRMPPVKILVHPQRPFTENRVY